MRTLNATVKDLGAALAAKQVSSIELTRDYLDRIAVAQGTLNAFITVDPEKSLAQARLADGRIARGDAGPLTGIPVAHKDIFCAAGWLTTCASKILANFIAPYDSHVIGRFNAAGAVLLGKTNMDEFAMGSSTENSHFGPVRNPWDLARVPGGSSGGSAAAVAARLAPCATGTDTGGSIRQPAAMCGVSGLKPTYGLVSRYGMIAFASSLDQGGPLACTAEDLALLLSAMVGFDPRDSTSLDRPSEDYSRALEEPLTGLRIGLPKEFFAEGMDDDVRQAVEGAIAEFRRLGATTAEVALPSTGLSVPAYYVIAPAEASSNLSRYDGVRYGYRAPEYADLLDMYCKTRAQGFGAEVKRRILVGTYVLSHGYYDAYYLQAQKVRRLIAQDFVEAFKRCDVILGPTSPTVAFPIGEKISDPVHHVPQRHLHDRGEPRRAAGDVYSVRLRPGRAPGRAAGGRRLLRRSASAQRRAPLPTRHRLASAEAGRGERLRAATMEWETVIGLETHAQLSTRSKMFSGASTAFGAAPNTQVSAVDIALPGTLPVANRGAVERAIRFGLAVGGGIRRRSVFARKNYFYPDLPKGYQISQYEAPVVDGGAIPIAIGGEARTIRLTRAHLEEDAGKLLHDDFHGMSGVDFNRAGIPLLEIVTEPDMRSAEEAVAYARALHALVRWIDICDGNMQEGSFRCDANVSVRRPGGPLGTRCEIKNLNSFRFLERAIEHEARRQIGILEGGGTVVQETRLYDPDRDETRSLRTKEDAHDYRYFPDPDLLPLAVGEQWIEAVRADMPELPEVKRERYVRELGLAASDALTVTQQREMAEYFEDVLRNLRSLSNAGINREVLAKAAATWVTGELSGALNKAELDIGVSPIRADQLAQVIWLVLGSVVPSRTHAREVFARMWEHELAGMPDRPTSSGESAAVRDSISAEQIARELGFDQVVDTSALDAIVAEVLAANPKQIEDYRAGKDKAFNSLVGQVMKATKGKANPAQVNELLKKKLAG